MVDMIDGVNLISIERERQISKEGWTAEHDDKYTNNQLVDAAKCYLSVAHQRSKRIGWFESKCDIALESWPWDELWFKPTTQIKDLVKAGALIAAEIDRLIRKQMTEEKISDVISKSDTEVIIMQILASPEYEKLKFPKLTEEDLQDFLKKHGKEDSKT